MFTEHGIQRLFAAALALALACGCSIKEVRDECPCYTRVNLDAFIAAGLTDGNVLYSSSEGLFNEEISFTQYIGKGYEIIVPRSPVMCAVLAGGTESSRFSREVVYTAYHREADPLFAYTETCDKNADDYTVTAVPHKQYCKINFVHTDRDFSQEYPYLYRVTCKWNGLNLFTLKPEEGDYTYVATQNSDGRFSMIVPRQGSYDMLFEIVLPRADDKWDAVTVYSVDIGAAIRDSGYDWDAEDLDDIEITVNFMSLTPTVTVIDWTKDYTYDDVTI